MAQLGVNSCQTKRSCRFFFFFFFFLLLLLLLLSSISIKILPILFFFNGSDAAFNLLVSITAAVAVLFSSR